MLRRLLQPFRVLTIFAMIVIFLTHMAILWPFVRNRWKRTSLSNRVLRHYCRVGLWVLGVKVKSPGLAELPPTNGLFVGNHLSYLDVLVFSSQRPACFVTSMEIKKAPGLGQICIMAGALFIDRKSKVNIRNEIAELREGLENGLNVAIFPEATSTNGEQILRFRRPLFTAAIDADRPVIPFCLNYHHVGGKPINRISRDKVFWYGDMDFMPHLWALAGSGGVEVNLHFLTALSIEKKEDEATDLAARSQALVESVFRPVTN